MVSTSSEGTPAEPPTSSPPPNLPEESRASRRLTILTEGRWTCDEDRDHVLKMLCEAMAQDRLGKPFWALKYQVNPISQTGRTAAPSTTKFSSADKTKLSRLVWTSGGLIGRVGRKSYSGLKS